MKFKIIPNEQTPKVEQNNDNFISLQDDKKMLLKFLSFARRQHNCVGLAANQVNLDGERIMKRFFAIKFGHFWDVIIGPEIIDYIGTEEIKQEGCLTWIGRKLVARRFDKICVNYASLGGEIVRDRIIQGLEAQIWQHEYNHLCGVREVFAGNEI